ncbi:LRR receptor-like serine/threonine-protein kinase FLS2 [Tanacetum coccineum]
MLWMKIFILVLSFMVVDVVSIDPSLVDEADAMNHFKDLIKEDPNGALANWNHDSIHHCNWTGIKCDRDSGHIVSISIQDKKLKGKISHYLGKLPSLKFLDLSRNSFTGNIPFQLQLCLQLMTVNLNHNLLSGPIPWQLGKIQNLTILHLEHNQLSDSIPESLCDCRSLIEIHLQENNLSGTIPDRIGELKELQFLDLSQNQLSGIIPEEISKIPTLKYLNLSFNQLQGKVPDNGIFKNRSATGLLGNPFLCFPKSNKTLCNYNPSKPSNHFLHVGVVTLTTVLSSGLILGAILVVLRFRHFRRKNLRDSENAEHEYTPTVNIKRFYRKELEDATNNFSEGNILGVGRLSTVYKGKLADGRMIAVKTFNFREHSAQSAKSFKREMETLGKLRHRNLLKVLGYAWESQRLQAVVLEYMENGNLDNAIHNSVIYQSRWTLSERVGVLVSVSRGLFYLHTGYDSPIVHCDLKPSNILLDDKWNARVSDLFRD